MDLYPWLVVTHVVAALAFVGAHAVSAFAMYRVKAERDRARLAAYLDLSGRSLPIAFVALLVLLVAGIAAGILGGYFGKLWIWASIAVLVVVLGAMTPLAAIPMNRLRRALGLPTRSEPAPAAPGTDEEVGAAQAALRPRLAAGIGGLAVVALVALMSLKPF